MKETSMCALFILVSLHLVQAKKFSFATNVFEESFSRSELLLSDLDTICKWSVLEKFDQFMNMRVFYFFEQKTDVPIASIVKVQAELANKLIAKFTQSFQSFEKNKVNVQKVAIYYFRSKLTVLLQYLDKIIGYRNLEREGFDLAGIEESIANQKHLTAHLDTHGYDVTYLRGIMNQLSANSWDNDYIMQINLFIAEMASRFVPMAEYYFETSELADANWTELAVVENMFNTFIQLKTWTKVAAEIATANKAQMKSIFTIDTENAKLKNIFLEILFKNQPMIPKFKDPLIPQFFQNKEIYAIAEESDHDLMRVIKIDMTIFYPGSHFDSLGSLSDIMFSPYIFLNNWLEFFDFKKKFKDQKSAALLTNEATLQILTNAHIYIYYFYSEARHYSLLTREDNSVEGVADFLYGFIKDSDCFPENTDWKSPNQLSELEERGCTIHNLMNISQYLEYYLIMLALLKPYTKTKGEFDKADYDLLLAKFKVAKNVDVIQTHSDIIQSISTQFTTTVTTLKFKGLKADLLAEVNKIITVSSDKKKLYDDRFVIREKVQQITTQINTKIETVYPILKVPPKTKDEADEFYQVIKILIDRLTRKDSAITDIVIYSIGAKVKILEQVAADKPQKDSVKLLQLILVDWAINRILMKSGLDDTHPFVHYLQYTSAKAYMEGLNGGSYTYFQKSQYEEVRRMDLFIFNYKVKERTWGTEKSEHLKEYKDELDRSNQMSIASLEMDFSIFERIHVYDYMMPFINLFKYSEIPDASEKVGMTSERIYSHRFVEIYDMIYKFLADLRLKEVSSYSLNGDPVSVLWNEIEFCMSQRYTEATAGTPVEDKFGPIIDKEIAKLAQEKKITLDKFKEQPEYAKFMKMKSDIATCPFTYEEMSRVYYFFYLKYNNDGIANTVHTNLFKNNYLVNPEYIYEFMYKFEVDFQPGFNKYCDAISKTSDDYDSTCFGFQIYKIYQSGLKEFPAMTLESANNFNKYIVGAYESLIKPAKISDLRYRGVYWSAFRSLAGINLDNSGQFSALINMINYKIFKPEDLRLDLENNPGNVSFLASFLFFNLKTPSVKNDWDILYRKSVEEILASQNLKNFITHVTYKEAFFAPVVKFLIDYSSTIDHFKKIAEILITMNQMKFVLAWKRGPHVWALEIQKELGTLPLQVNLVTKIKEKFSIYITATIKAIEDEIQSKYLIELKMKAIEDREKEMKTKITEVEYTQEDEDIQVTSSTKKVITQEKKTTTREKVIPGRAKVGGKVPNGKVTATTNTQVKKTEVGIKTEKLQTIGKLEKQEITDNGSRKIMTEMTAREGGFGIGGGGRVSQGEVREYVLNGMTYYKVDATLTFTSKNQIEGFDQLLCEGLGNLQIGDGKNVAKIGSAEISVQEVRRRTLSAENRKTLTNQLEGQAFYDLAHNPELVQLIISKKISEEELSKFVASMDPTLSPAQNYQNLVAALGRYSQTSTLMIKTGETQKKVRSSLASKGNSSTLLTEKSSKGVVQIQQKVTTDGSITIKKKFIV